MTTYSRVYMTIRDDERFGHVYECDTCLAWWIRLLLDADALWPATAHLPFGLPDHALDELAKSGLIERINGTRYKVHGLDAERERRSGQAKGAADARWAGKPLAEQANTISLDSDDPVVAYASLAGGYPSPKAMNWLDQLSEQYGAKAVLKALAQAKAPPGKLISAAQDILRLDARDLDKKEKEAEQIKVRDRRVDGMIARRMEWFKNTGKWDEGWGARP